MNDKQLKEPVMIHAWIEKYDRAWLRKESLKRKISIAQIIRNLIKKLRNES